MLHLPVKKRDTKKEKAKNILKEGLIPGVVYGPKTPSTPVAIKGKKFNDAYNKAGETTLIALDYAGEKKQAEDKDDKKDPENVVLIRDVQVHPVKGDFVHVDFYQLPLDKPIEISVPVEPLGEAPAVKEQGGVLVHNLHEIDIKALPKDLIHDITVDITGLEEIDDSILVKDLTVSDKVEILADEEEVVFMVEEPREEEEEELDEEEIESEEDEQIADIKTEGEEKREEREAEKAEQEQGGEGEQPPKKEPKE